MNKKILLSIAFFTFSVTVIFAQDWTIGGNNLTGNGKFGSTNKKDIVLISNNKERGALTRDGLLGIGTTTPNSLVHINSASNQDPFRVQVSGGTRFFVDSLGGTAIGAFATPPPNGLFVSGNTGLGTTSPTQKLHVVGNILATGNLNVAGITSSAAVSATSLSTSGSITASGNLDVSGTVGFGSVETFSDGGFNTIQSNSDIIPDADGSRNLGTTARTWASVHAISYLTTLPPPSALKSSQNLKAGLPEIMKLRPISYTDGDVNKFALIGTEVKTVLPEVTSETEIAGTENAASRTAKKKVDLSLDYDALIPVLIKGMQEQQQIIASLQEKVAQLETQLNSSSSENARSGVKTIAGAILEQNQPNPFSQSTVIRYHLPQGTSGQINIYDNKGILMKSFRTNESGQATVNASDLKPGTYTYTLSVNGKLAESKKLVLVN